MEGQTPLLSRNRVSLSFERPRVCRPMNGFRIRDEQVAATFICFPYRCPVADRQEKI